ncbi:hypothetical protein POSPLADRAFT_1038709 [Postia placenta MAD-698-R-SB12]|uniref:Uncharacterized protein n=1 Tax=Postia placenta MAD-698-R-SB12 TaxID=670580 RepID=A0A1X6NDZ2_9APHY|nr:hypothetical protein POSPLADRAFT_1038709 [Postia placenta MAD-698-R-SB12]OSX66730.1 hypothetical protein POSPLADRAFT_1038709 [Postia placenta MAD-698-R-SB12]
MTQLDILQCFEFSAQQSLRIGDRRRAGSGGILTTLQLTLMHLLGTEKSQVSISILTDFGEMKPSFLYQYNLQMVIQSNPSISMGVLVSHHTDVVVGSSVSLAEIAGRRLASAGRALRVSDTDRADTVSIARLPRPPHTISTASPRTLQPDEDASHLT